MNRMSYIDANIFIYAVLNSDEKSKQCIQILKKIMNNKIIGFTSLLTWDEFYYSIKKYLNKEDAIKKSAKFLQFPNLIFLSVDDKIIIKAHDLIKEYNLKPRDAIHAASALIHNIKEIISDDSDFDKVKELKRIKIVN